MQRTENDRRLPTEQQGFLRGFLVTADRLKKYIPPITQQSHSEWQPIRIRGMKHECQPPQHGSKKKGKRLPTGVNGHLHTGRMLRAWGHPFTLDLGPLQAPQSSNLRNCQT